MALTEEEKAALRRSAKLPFGSGQFPLAERPVLPTHNRWPIVTIGAAFVLSVVALLWWLLL